MERIILNSHLISGIEFKQSFGQFADKKINDRLSIFGKFTSIPLQR